MQSLTEIADEFTALMAAGDLQAAGRKYWAQDISIVEPINRQEHKFQTVTGYSAAQILSLIHISEPTRPY